MKIKIVDLNLWMGAKLFKNLQDFVESENPDIIAYQEVWDSVDQSGTKKYNNIVDFGKNLGFEHTFFSPAFQGKTQEGEEFISGNMICSKFPVEKKETFFYDIPFGKINITKWLNGTGDIYTKLPRNLQHAVISTNGTLVNLFNTQGIWDTHGDDNERRLKMGETIIDKIKEKPKVILTGDFNVNEGTQTIDKIEKHLANVFGGELTSTFNMRQKDSPGFADAVVDMIFVSHNIKILEHRVPPVDISDHLPLVCVLEV